MIINLNVRKLFLLIILFATVLSITYRDVGSFVVDIDLTILVIVNLFLLLVYYVFDHEKGDILLIVFIFLLFTFQLASLSWSRAPAYGVDKLKLFFPYVIISLFSKKLISKHILSFQYLIIFFAFFILIRLFFDEDMLTSKFYRMNTGEDTNPIKLGKFFGLSLICVYYIMLELKMNPLLKWAVLFFVIVSTFVGMGLTGSKGPIFSIILSYLLIRIFSSKRVFLNLVIIFLIGFVTVNFVLPQFFISLPPEVQSFIDLRFNIEEDKTGSFSSRAEMIDLSLNHITDRGNFFWFFGNGVGDFQYLSRYHSYPHNIFIEVLYEYGLFTFIFFILIIARFFWQIARFKYLKNHPRFIIFSGLFVLLNACTTGDISDNFSFFLFFFLHIHQDKSVNIKV